VKARCKVLHVSRRGSNLELKTNFGSGRSQRALREIAFIRNISGWREVRQDRKEQLRPIGRVRLLASNTLLATCERFPV
jgi:hypothetical protein